MKTPEIQFSFNPRLVELQQKAQTLAISESEARAEIERLKSELDCKKQALEAEYNPRITGEFTKRHYAKKESERLKSQINTFYANDGETLAALFVQHTGIALKEAFMYGNGKNARIALYNKQNNHFGIYSYKPNAKGERALLIMPDLANCKYAFEIAKKLGEFFKQCRKISEPAPNHAPDGCENE